jgi:hypothetical protein
MRGRREPLDVRLTPASDTAITLPTEPDMRRHRMALPRVAVLATVLLQTSGCSSWHVEPGTTAATLIANTPPSRVRLQLHTGQRLELRHPALDRDTLIGFVGHDSARTAIADIATVAQRRFSIGRTAARVGLSLGVLFALAALACAADPCGY